LIAEKGVPPYNILAVTFTNKAAGEMRERVETFCKNTEIAIRAADFDFSQSLRAHFAAGHRSICRKATQNLSRFTTRRFAESYQSLRQRHRLDEKQLAARKVQAPFQLAKNRGEDFEMYASRVEYTDERRAAIARVFKMYEERLNNANALDLTIC
jgi:DNA helicase-2/ATP-dependent DNA helicase PcrA